MPTAPISRSHTAVRELHDAKQKLGNARQATKSGRVGKRAKADLKLLEQEAAGKKLKAVDAMRRESKLARQGKTGTGKDRESKLDRALKDSFPGSDPVSFIQAAPAGEKRKKNP